MAQSPSRCPNRHNGLDTVVSIQTASPIAPSVEVSPENSANGVAAGTGISNTPQIIIRPDFVDEDCSDAENQDAADEQGHHHHHHHHHLPHTGARGSIMILAPPAQASASSAVSRINICINNHYPTKSKPRPRPRPRRLHPQFGLSDDVLVRKENDDRYYLGTVIAIGAYNCLVRFDDGTQSWAFFDEMKKIEISGSEVAVREMVDRIARMPRAMCVVCNEDKPQQMVLLCERCHLGYHVRCQAEQQPDQVVDELIATPEAGPWLCRRCSTPSPPPGCSGIDNRFISTGLSQELDPLTDKDQLPYDLDALVWDAAHQVNQSGQYCYCGEDGDWAKEMIQCCWCLQWFHGRCIRSLQFPIFLGDRFYVLLCSICNGGHEFVRRLETSYSDLLQVVLYNLIMRNGQRLFSLPQSILPYLEDNLRTLQAPENITNTSSTARAEAVESTLRRDRNVFINGKELNMSSNLWTLRVCQAPEKVAVNIPRGETVTESMLQQPAIQLRILPRAYLEKSLVTDAATRERMTGITYNSTPFSEADPRQTSSESTLADVDDNSPQQPGTAVLKKRGRPSAASLVATAGFEAKMLVSRPTNKRKKPGRSQWKPFVEEAQGSGVLLNKPCLMDRVFPLPSDLLGADNPFRNQDVVAPRPRHARSVKQLSVKRLSTSDINSGRNKKRKLNIGGGTAVYTAPAAPLRILRRKSTGTICNDQNSTLEFRTASSAALSTTTNTATGGQQLTRRLRPRTVANYSDTRRYRPRDANKVNDHTHTNGAPLRSRSLSMSNPVVTEAAPTFSDGERVAFEPLSEEVVVKLERIADEPNEQDILQFMTEEKKEEQIQESYVDAPLRIPQSPSPSPITCVRSFSDGDHEFL